MAQSAPRFEADFTLISQSLSSTSRLPHHFIGSLEHAVRNCQTNLFCRLKVYDEFKLGCLLHRQISWFGTFQDCVNVNGRAPKEVVEVRPVGHQTALIDKLLLWVNNWQVIFAGKLDDPLSFGEKGASTGRHNRAHLLLLCGLKGAF
jgi:hypothetical protein